MARLLLIEDDLTELERYRDALRAEGHDIVVAFDGADGLDKLTPDIALIVVDLMTPIVDGYDVVKQVRRTPGHEKTPIIVASGVATGDWALYLGADRYLRKPFDVTVLTALVNQLLSDRA